MYHLTIDEVSDLDTKVKALSKKAAEEKQKAVFGVPNLTKPTSEEGGFFDQAAQGGNRKATFGGVSLGPATAKKPVSNAFSKIALSKPVSGEDGKFDPTKMGLVPMLTQMMTQKHTLTSFSDIFFGKDFRYRGFAEKLEENGVTIEIVSNSTDKFFGSYAGGILQINVYDINKHKTKGDKKGYGLANLGSTFVHEMIHGVLDNIPANKRKTLEKELQQFLKELKPHMSKMSASVLGMYNLALKDSDELITYAFSNKEFATFLSSLKIDLKEDAKKPKTSFWSRLKTLLLEKLPKSLVSGTKLDELSDIMDNVMESNADWMSYTKGNDNTQSGRFDIDEEGNRTSYERSNTIADIAFDPSFGLANELYQAGGIHLSADELIEKGIVSLKDEETGKPCLAAGANFGFTPGGSWKVIKEFKGKSHERGGIDISVGENGIKMIGKSGDFKAKNGVVINAKSLNSDE